MTTVTDSSRAKEIGIDPNKKFTEVVSGDMGKDNRVVVPEAIRDHLDLEAEDKLVFFYDDSDDFATVKKHLEDEHKREAKDIFKKKPLHKRVLTIFAFLIPMLLIPQVAFAQEPVIVSPPPTSGQISGSMPTFVYRAGAAYFPLTIEVKYPAGYEDIERVSTISDLSPHNLNKQLTADGVIFKTFTTGVGDTFTFEFGQKYATPVDQVSTWVATANGQVVAEGSYPVKGTEFQIRLVFATSAAPQIPTQEQLNAGVYERLDRMRSNDDILLSKITGMETAMYLASNALYSTVGINGIVILIGIGTLVVIFGLRRQIKSQGANMFKMNKTKDKGNGTSYMPIMPPKIVLEKEEHSGDGTVIIHQADRSAEYEEPPHKSHSIFDVENPFGNRRENEE